MKTTAEKFFVAERERLAERRTVLEVEIAALNDRLTEARRESMLLDDVIARLDAHLPAVSATDAPTLERVA